VNVGGVVLVVAAVWLGCQLLHGDMLGRLDLM